jgi:hypothetical protein
MDGLESHAKKTTKKITAENFKIAENSFSVATHQTSLNA